MKIQKKKFLRVGVGGGGPIRGWGGGGWGSKGDVGYGGCKPRIKGIDKCK